MPPGTSLRRLTCNPVLPEQPNAKMPESRLGNLIWVDTGRNDVSLDLEHPRHRSRISRYPRSFDRNTRRQVDNPAEVVLFKNRKIRARVIPSHRVSATIFEVHIRRRLITSSPF
jgi:hypothetical protein